MQTKVVTADIARREEARVALALSEMADESRVFAGGIMARGVPGAWFNCAQGVGLAGAVEAEELDGMVQFFEEKGIEPRVEICPFVDASLIDGLARLGFVLRRFETVFYRSLAVAEDFAPPYPALAGLTIEVVDKRDPAAAEAFARVCLSGFLPDGVEPSPDLLASAARVVPHARTVAIRAMVDGRCVGAGAMEFHEDLSALYGVSVVPDARRKGIQLAMMAWRLRKAAERGATMATISSLPGASTETNAVRMGFRVAYNKAVLVRPGEGLAPVEVG